MCVFDCVSDRVQMSNLAVSDVRRIRYDVK